VGGISDEKQTEILGEEDRNPGLLHDDGQGMETYEMKSEGQPLRAL
jgi:hypothetical protein